MITSKGLIFSSYYCRGCNSIVERPCHDKTIVSMCDSIGFRKVRLVKVNDDVKEIFLLLKTLSKQ